MCARKKNFSLNAKAVTGKQFFGLRRSEMPEAKDFTTRFTSEFNKL